jgi:di/tricarboxylate transporter
VEVQEDCQDIGKAVRKSRLVNDYNIQILTLTRNGKRLYAIGPDTIIERNDIIRGVLPPDILNNLRNIKGYTIKGDKKVGKADMETDEKHIYEVIIPFGSAFHLQSLKSLNFRRIYNSSVIALRHKEDLRLTEFSEAKLKEGDMLLILGTVAEIQQLANEKRIVILSEYKQEKANYKKAIPALIIALGVVLLATFNITSILISSMIGALLMVVLAILKPAEAYKAVEWKVIFMMAGVLSMGAALEKTGGAEKIALIINDTLGSYNAHITLSILYLVTFLSTNVLSSKATAALMTPIVISLAAAMEVSERPFLIAVMFACSLTFMTPVSYPTNTMVYAPGNYKFNDFLKVGTPLNIITWIAASLIIPYFFPF